MYDKDKRRKRRHNTRRCERRLKKMYNNGYGAVREFDEESRGRTVVRPYYCKWYRSKMSSYCKKLTNRRIRRCKGEIHKGGNYRKIFDMWWTLY